MKISFPLFGMCALFLGQPAVFGETVFSSGTHQVSLVELYTSEGCSSCPPAERWMSGLTGGAGLWTQYVPVAFHVTYWDNLGWKDITGQSDFNDRQREIAASWGTGTVYTPCFVRNGKQWQPSGRTPDIDKGDSTGVLSLALQDKATIHVTYAPEKGGGGDFEATVVLLGSGIHSKVQRGENAGSELLHDFAVLQIEKAELKPGADGRWVADVKIQPGEHLAPRLAIAGWVVVKGSLQPIQATGGWLP